MRASGWSAGEARAAVLSEASLEWVRAESGIAMRRALGVFVREARAREKFFRDSKAAAVFASGSFGALGLGAALLGVGAAAAAPLLGAGVAGASLGGLAAGILWLKGKASGAKVRGAFAAKDQLEELGKRLKLAKPGDTMEMGKARMDALKLGRSDPQVAEDWMFPQPSPEPSLVERIREGASRLKGRVAVRRALRAPEAPDPVAGPKSKSK